MWTASWGPDASNCTPSVSVGMLLSLFRDMDSMSSSLTVAWVACEAVRWRSAPLALDAVLFVVARDTCLTSQYSSDLIMRRRRAATRNLHCPQTKCDHHHTLL